MKYPVSISVQRQDFNILAQTFDEERVHNRTLGGCMMVFGKDELEARFGFAPTPFHPQTPSVSTSN